MTSTIISDPMRVPVVAYAREAGGVVISRGARYIALSATELDRLVKFTHGAGRLMRYPVS
jgi:hypothetical protein